MRKTGLLLLAAVTAAAASTGAQNSEELARRQYESGRSFVQNGRYTEALKDFQAVVDSFPQSAVADDALLDMAVYQLEVAGDRTAAQAATDRILKDYPASDSAPMAYVLLGRLTIARSRAAADVDTALASFERVPRLFPGSPAVAAARYYTGETLRLSRRTDDAIQQFRRVTAEYPRSVWAARADLAAAVNLVATDRATQTFGTLQRIRQQFPNTAEAATALNFNTILYRLYMRKPAAYAFAGRYIGGEKDRFRDVIGLATDPAGRILIGHKQGIAIYDPKGPLVRSVPASDMSAFFADGRERVVLVRGALMLPEKAAPISLVVPQPGREPREIDEVSSVITLSGGDRLLADRKSRSVIRMTAAGKYVSTFATANAERLARNEFDDVAMIDRDSKGILVVDRDGKPVNKIPPKGTGYQFEDPADIAYDGLGHLYVLDGRRAAIYVFGAKNRLVTTIASTGKDAGALQRPRAMVLDPTGRIYVFDEGSQRIQVYQ